MCEIRFDVIQFQGVTYLLYSSRCKVVRTPSNAKLPLLGREARPLTLNAYTADLPSIVEYGGGESISLNSMNPNPDYTYSYAFKFYKGFFSLSLWGKPYISSMYFRTEGFPVQK